MHKFTAVVLMCAVWLLGAGVEVFAVPPSESAKKNLLKETAKLSTETENALKKYQALKSENKLEEKGNSFNCLDLASQLRNNLRNAIEAYDAATSNQNDGHDPWPVGDADVAKAKGQLDELRKKLEEIGVWTCLQVGEAPNKSYSRFDNIYDVAWEAALLAKTGKINEAQERFRQLDQRCEGLLKETAVELAGHPALDRFKTAIEKWKKEAEGPLSKAAGERGAVEKDVNDLVALQEKYLETFQKIEGLQQAYGQEEEIIKNMNALVAACETFEKNDLPGIQKAVDDFGAKYGKQSLQISQNLFKLNGDKDPQYPKDPGNAYDRLVEGIQKVKNARVEGAEKMVSSAESDIQGIGNFSEDIQLKRMESAKTRIELATKLDPANAKAKDLFGKIDLLIASQSVAIEKAIDSRTWEPNSPSFQGPGDPDQLIAAAIKHYKDNDWEMKGKRELLAVRIAGDWRGGDKNLLGEYINYQLPTEVAFWNTDDKAAGKDKARVYFVSLYTRDKVQAPPFEKGGVGDNYWLRASKVKMGGGGGGSGTSAGLMGSIFWLALVAANLLAGLLAAAPLLSSKVPALSMVYQKITPVRNLLGVVALGVGLLCFLRAFFFFFAPFADILPQLAAILTGVFLGKELLLKKPEAAAVAAGVTEPPLPPADGAPVPAPEAAAKTGDAAAKAGEAVGAAAQKAQELLRKHQDLISKLETFQIPIGIACLVLGVLHLIIPGFWLF